MEKIKFVTGNKNKFDEVSRILGLPLEQVTMDLPEIQEINAEEIIRQKLLTAERHAKGEYLVDDISLYLDCLDGKLPGPLIKWFEKVLGNDGLAEMVGKLGNSGALTRTLVGYVDANGEISFFSGELTGDIVAPRGANGFGWDPIFQPKGEYKTLAEMTFDEKQSISSRGVAFRKLKDFLSSKK